MEGKLCAAMTIPPCWAYSLIFWYVASGSRSTAGRINAAYGMPTTSIASASIRSTLNPASRTC